MNRDDFLENLNRIGELHSVRSSRKDSRTDAKDRASQIASHDTFLLKSHIASERNRVSSTIQIERMRLIADLRLPLLSPVSFSFSSFSLSVFSSEIAQR